MSDNINLDQKVQELESAAKKYASKDTVISIGGYEFTPAKLMIAFTIVSSALGSLYGAFEVYKDYQGMKKRIAEYVAPDLSELNKKMELTQQNSDKSVQYTQDIKNDLKTDIRRLENVVENVERGVKQSQRETDQSVKDVLQELRKNGKEVDQTLKSMQRDVDSKLQTLQKEVDNKIQKAMDNPLAK
jgi:archaellum component FlaC